MTAQLGRVGNASSLHASGRDARRLVEESRERIARSLGSRPGEVVFTSGGTESDNLAVKGLFWSRRAEDPRRTRILSTPIEHHAVLDPLLWLSAEGAQVEFVDVDRYGRLDIEAFRATLESDPESVALVTVMWANNEVGTVQPVREVVEAARAHGIPVHTDAVQALGAVPLGFAASGVDAMTVTGHKIGGPYGIGALLVRRELQPTALLHGGGQERDIRSGTIDAPAIAGFAVACEQAVAQQSELAVRLEGLRETLVDGVLRVVPEAILNGDPLPGPEHRLPGTAHLAFPGCEGDSLLMLLDARGIECSTGSACDAGVPRASHVLLAMGATEEFARSSLRFSLGHTSVPADVDALLLVGCDRLEQLRVGEVRLELRGVQPDLVGQREQLLVAQLACGGLLAVGHEAVVEGPELSLQPGGIGGDGAVLGRLTEDIDVAPLEAHVAGLHVLHDGGLGLGDPHRAEGALIVGVDDDRHRRVDVADGERVIRFAPCRVERLLHVGLDDLGRRPVGPGGVRRRGGIGGGRLVVVLAQQQRGDESGGDEDDEQRDHPLLPACGARSSHACLSERRRGEGGTTVSVRRPGRTQRAEVPTTIVHSK